jgi:periplasmic protein TonB
MTFNQLNSALKRYTLIYVAWFCFIGCNDEKSANNSTSAETDTIVKADPPVAAKKKKKGKVTAASSADDTKTKMEKDKMGYYNYTEVLPAYDGGQTAMENYIVNTIQYPEDAINNNVEGVVTVQFGVDENGNVSNVSAIGNKLGYGLEEEAVRVVSNMPKWKPGQVKGKNVKTWRTLPINYRLQES